MSVQILTGDCRYVDLGGPYDACITDPPYGDTSLDWDTQVEGWIEAMAAALKPATSVWVFGSMRFLAPLFTDMANAGFTYSQDIVWQKQNGTGFHNDRFRRVHEHAVLFYRGAWADVHHSPQFTNDATARTVRRKTRPTHTGEIRGGAESHYESHYESHDGGPRLDISVQFERNEHGRAIHPTQKPVELLRKLIRYSVPGGGSVLDVFSGSASTAVAANLEGVDCTCVELDPEMATKSRERVAGGPLFLEAA